jgi:hypothetical protein
VVTEVVTEMLTRALTLVLAEHVARLLPRVLIKLLTQLLTGADRAAVHPCEELGRPAHKQPQKQGRANMQERGPPSDK